MIDYERLGDLDIINTYKDALIKKKEGPNYLFKGIHNAQNSNSMASMSSDSQYRLTKESFDQFLDHNIIAKSYFINFDTFGAVI